MPDWITTDVFAEIAGLTRRGARKAAAASESDSAYLWRGVRLHVQRSRGWTGGGQAGVRLEVDFRSLPEALQETFKGRNRPVQLALPLRQDDAAAAERRERIAIIKPIVVHPAGSAERVAALKTVLATPVFRDGKHGRLPERTVRNWVLDFDRGGEAALQPKARKDKGTVRHFLTARWDKATACLPAAEREVIAERAKRDIRSLWAHGASYAGVRRLASEQLADATRTAGIDMAPADLARACELPKHVVEAGRASRRVHEKRTNVKKWDDERPRVRLTSSHLDPMQIVYGDVHHFDVYLTRTDGTVATPKGIAWLDAHNRRLRVDLVLCEPGTGIRNADLIQSFIRMTQDPRWGVPRHLYLDNGSEYRFATFLDDPLKLAGLGCEASDRASSIFRAQPYNASAKGILEGTFRILEQKVLAPLTGYIAGDRMKTRTGNLGKAPVPYNGTFEQFAERYKGLETYFNTDPQSGLLKGLSPNVAFGRAVEAGWKRTDIDADALRTAFSVRETRKVRKGGIEVGGEWLYCDELYGLNGQTVSIQRPKFLEWDGVPVFTGKGTFVGVAKFDGEYARDDADGAREAARRRKVAEVTIAQLAAEVDAVDVPARMVASAERQPVPPMPESAGEITLNDAAKRTGKLLKESKREREIRSNQSDQDALRARLAVHRKPRA